MATIGNNADTLLQGLSDFWLRYFRDLGDLQATYEGTTMLFGQSYLDLMSSVLNQSVTDVPLFNKDYYRLITIREDQLVFKQTTNPNTTGWALPTDRYIAVPSLQNKVYEPTAALEANLDYLVNDGELVFLTDPTDPPAQGYAQRPVEVLCGGFFTATGVTNWRSLGVQKGDVLEATAAGQVARLFKVAHVGPTQLALSTSTPAPVVPAGATAQTYRWRLLRSRVDDGGVVSGLPFSDAFTGKFMQPGPLRVYEVSLWAVDAQVDDGELYRTFGHLFGAAQNSSESYRAFIRGLMQLYALGPTVDRIESALNVAAGLPVVRNDGEVLVMYEGFVSHQRVVTTHNEYVYASAIPLRADVMDPANAGTLVFRAFEPLTSAVRVVDYLKEPEWWHRIVIPEEFLPGRTEEKRTATPQLFPLKIGSAGNWQLGDVGVKIGATEDGLLRSNVYRHCAAFLLMDRYLKYHMFAVRVSNALGADAINRLQGLLHEMKPTYTAIHFQLFT